jgi:hypothetical protein
VFTHTCVCGLHYPHLSIYQLLSRACIVPLTCIITFLYKCLNINTHSDEFHPSDDFQLSVDEVADEFIQVRDHFFFIIAYVCVCVANSDGGDTSSLTLSLTIQHHISASHIQVF